MNKKIIVLTGPTSSGKTNLAIQTAKKINAEIICADSRIVYKNLDIVSAKPNIKETEGIKHHLIDIIEADRDFSAGDFCELSQKIIENTDKNIIVSGGTWFYINSLLGEFSLIECSKNQKLRDNLSLLDNNALWKKLYELDSKRAQLIHPNNKDKIIRSIEMCIFLNKPLSEQKRKKNTIQAKWFMPYFERESLYQKINQRTDKMIEQGLFDEWQKNKEKYPGSKILENTIGYREFFDLQKGVYTSFEQAVEKIKQHTRNFAKRQITYFKSRNDIEFLSDDFSSVFNYIDKK